MNIEYEIILQNQLDALENNQVDFILYGLGAGGEFLSYLISKYSKNYFELAVEKDLRNRYLIKTHFLCEYFTAKLTNKNPNDILTIEDIISVQNSCVDAILKDMHLYKYRELDLHLNSGKKCITRTHIINNVYMNNTNTFYIKPDTSYWLHYSKDLAILKISGDNEIPTYGKHFDNNDANFATPILMSQMFNKGYLEEMFNIEGDEFHKELRAWHKKNKKLISDSRE
jgi:hypothetical protein